MNNISEDKISEGIAEFARFKTLAKEAIDRCKMAEEEAQYYKGQKELLENQKKLDEERHQSDLRRIAELEAFITGILETFARAEEKLRLAYRKPVSTHPTEADLHEGIRKLAASTGGINPSDRIGSVPNQKAGT